MMLGFGFGPQELLIVAGIILLLFGGAKLPGLMRNLGRSITEFKAGVKDKPRDSIDEQESDTPQIRDQRQDKAAVEEKESETAP